MMKRYIMTLVGALMALTIFAQTVLVVETNEAIQKYYYADYAQVSFWGQPKGQEQNGDLTITPTEVKGESISFVMKVTQWEDFANCGLIFSAEEGQWIPEDSIYLSGETGRCTDISMKGNVCKFVINTDFDINDECVVTILGLKPNTTYYVKPFVNYAIGTEASYATVFGSEKSATTLLTLSSLITQEMFGSWYLNTPHITATQGVLMLPTAEAWKALCSKYGSIFGEEEPSEAVQQSLTNEWFRHLTPAEMELMKEYSVAYYDNCEGGDVYVIDRICDDLIPNLLKVSGDIDLMKPNLEEDSSGYGLYTKNCEVQTVVCDASYGIEGNKYVTVTPTSSSVNPVVGYNLPFTLLPNRIYNVSVTIAPNTEDATDERPNRFYVYLFKEGKSVPKRIVNPQTSTEEETDYYFVYGGQELETFTIQLDTHDVDFLVDVLQLSSQITTKMTKDYSPTLRIARISIAPEMEEVVKGDVDMDGTLDKDDVQTVAAAVVLGEEKKTEETSEEQPSTDFTGDGKTLIDDIVALVNYIQTGSFKPSSSKARARYAPAKAPAFTTEQQLDITAGENTTMSIDMSGMADYTAISFDIRVPQGVRIATDQNGKPQVALGGIATAKHNVKVAMQDEVSNFIYDGGEYPAQIISVACYADDNACFTKDAGSIITMEMTAVPTAVPIADARILLENCMVTQPNLSSVMLDKYSINAGVVNGIEDVEDTTLVSSASAVAYYTLNGIQLSAPQKGLNIVKMSDGQTKKVWVK